MTTSVVVCAYSMQRWEDLKTAVRSCLAQTLPPDEVLVVIDHNEELLAQAQAELSGPRVQVLPNRSTQGLSGARNTGVATSQGEIILFLDDDAYADPTWLAHLIAPMAADPSVAGTGGWVVPDWESAPAVWFPQSFYWILGCSYAGLPPSGGSLRNPIGASMAMRRAIFESVGGFTSGIGRIGLVPLGCEETEICIRYTATAPNARFVHVRDAVVHHRVPASRLTWHYFWTRCWAEGLSKAAVTSLVGSDSGLSEERRHVMRSMPRELAQSIRSFPHQRRTSLTRAALILVGTACAAAGLVRGRLALRGSPLTPGGDDLALICVAKAEDPPVATATPLH